MWRPRCCYCIFCSLLGLVLAWLILLGNPPSALAQAPKKGQISFINDIAPIFKENACFACHDSKKKKGKLDLSTYETFRAGGTKDDPVTPGKPKESILIDVLTSTGADRMPPKDAGEALSKEKIAIISKWIEQGAKLDSGLNAKADVLKELRLRWKPPAPPTAYKFPVNINALAFTPDGKKLVVGGYHELTVWDPESGKLEKRLATRSERAYSLVFLPDGKLAVAGGRPGQEGNLRIYNLDAPGKMMDGVTLLDGVNDKKVFLGELLDTDDVVLALALSPDGKKLASGGCDRQVRLWDISNGFSKAKLEQSVENHADWVFAVAFSPDGNYLVTGSRDKTAKVWDLKAKESLLTFPDHQNIVYAVAMLPDGKLGVSVGEDNNLRIWQTTDEKKQIGKQTKASGGHSKGIFKMAVSSDPKNFVLATCSADGSVRLWDAAGTSIKTLTGHTDWVYAVALSPDGKKIAAGSWNGEVRVWNLPDGSLVRAFNASPGFMAPQAAEAPKK